MIPWARLCVLTSLAVVLTVSRSTALMAASPEEVARQLDGLLEKEIRKIAQNVAAKSPSATQKPKFVFANQCDDETFLRRTSLDLTGNLPTPEQIIAFSLDPAKDKRTKLVKKLLASDSYGENWARYWRDAVFFRQNDQRALLGAIPMTAYLTEEFNKNTPWDRIVTEFITAEGDVRKDGRTGIIAAQLGRPEETAAEVSRLFLGIQIQCAQCHDHPTDRWNREQFHELAAFFPRVAVRPDRTAGNRSYIVEASDRPQLRSNNNGNRYRGTPEHYMSDLEDPTARGTKMQPIFFATGQELEFGTVDAKRRSELAAWMTSANNEWFAKAMVNRVWAELVGEPFFEHIDDIGPDRTPTAPESLDYLAKSFAQSGYDLKWLFATVTATEAYQRESRPPRLANEAPMMANTRRRLRADQLYTAITTALGIAERVPANPRQLPQFYVRSPRGQFLQKFNFDPSSQVDDISGSIAQALLLMNSPEINSAIRADRPGGLGKLLSEIKDDGELIAELYLRTLAREPNEAEMKKSLAYVKKVGKRSEAFEDLLWALVNSTEFLERK